MRWLLFTCVLATGCGDDGGMQMTQSDAPTANADVMVDQMMATMPTCAAYCTSIQANCTAANAQYAGSQNCLDTCAAFTVGTLADQNGNTLGCRLYHANAAQSAPGTHCPHAGPLGGGQCGTDQCAAFCQIATAECATQWPNAGNCATTCSGWTSTAPYSTASTGDTLECRMYHLTMASSNPGGHCSHTEDNSATCQ